MIGKTLSHYTILEKLGEGGMGVVYKAEDTRLKRTVALKFLPHGLESHEGERARFLQEAQAASALNHPNVCTIYDIGAEGDQQFIVMEYVDGKTLRQMVPIKKMQTAIDYAVQIGEALQEAHSKGIVHRDIKTDNIMVNSKNQIKVMDFGLAKLRGSLKLTKSRSTVGTLAYMAPEQIQGGEVDARSDIFSFGIVLYEMLTGHLPFRGEHDAAMMYSIVNDEPEPLQHYMPDAQSELLHILDRALEKDREDRYQTAHDMLIDLRRLKKDSSRVARQPQSAMPMPAGALPVPPAEAKNGWSKRLLIGTTVIIAVCVLTIILLLPKTNSSRLNPNRTTVTLKIPFNEISYPSLSRDGNWVAFAGRDENEQWDIYMMNIAGGTPSRVTNESAWSISNCEISPDVGQIAYDCLKNEPNPSSKVKLVASQGGSSRTLADTGLGPKWRADGKRIGYFRVGDSQSAWLMPSVSGKFEIWSIRPDGSDKRLELIDSITARMPGAFCWSPDGGSITWVREYPEGYGEVMVRELSTGRERQLTSDRKTVDEVNWATNDEILFVSNKSGQTNLWVIPSGGGKAIQVTQGAIPISGPRMSADNKTLVYMQREFVVHIWTSSINGTNARQITSGDVQVKSATFSPDGRHISYVLADVDAYNAEAHLYVMDRDGKTQRQLTYGSEVVRGCSWSPDSRWLAYSSRALGEPEDSSRVYFMQPLNPGAPRLLCKGDARWLDNESLLVFSQMKTQRYSITGGMPIQVYLDSTNVLSILGKTHLLIRDYRIGREASWVVPVDSLGIQKGEARRMWPSDAITPAAPADRRFWIYRKGDDLWRVWTATGKEERLGTALPGEALMQDVSMDGKEILWTVQYYPSKLVLVKNVFE